MLKLHGFPSSNYYNLVKLTLLEKEIEFEECLVYPGAGESYRPDYLEMSPMGKIPCLETGEGMLSESRAIVDYLEEAFPDRPRSYPEAPFERAKVREICQVIDLYLELSARRVLRNFFARKKPPDGIAREVTETLTRGAQALARLASFDGYLLGDRFTAADASAVIHLPVVRLLSEGVLDFDPLAPLSGVDHYLARLEQRPAVQRVRKDQGEDFPRFVAHLQETFSR